MRMPLATFALAFSLAAQASEQPMRNPHDSLGVPGDPIEMRYAPFLQNGCFDGPPIATTEQEEGMRLDQLPGLDDMPMSGDSIRFVITPDSYRDDGLLMVQIDSGMRRSMGAEGQPFLIATAGNWRRTCTVRMPLDECPEAAQVKEDLARLRIPVGYGMGPLDRLTLHATSYSMQFYGHNLNRLSYFGVGNPLEEPLEKAKALLQPCWQPAFDALSTE